MQLLNNQRSFYTILHYELLIACRHYTELFNPVFFFTIIITLFPFGISPAPQILQMIAPGIIWITILLATLLALNKLFQTDWQDGSLDQLLLSKEPLMLIILAKLIAYWLLNSLPLILLASLAALFLQLSFAANKILFLSLLLGSPLLILIGAIGRALTLRLRNSGLLMILIILPFYIPILIFGANAVTIAQQGAVSTGQLAWLAALLVLAIPLAPWATAAALRIEI